MSELDDIMGDLFAAIDQLPDAPNLDQSAPGEIDAMGAALGLAQSLLAEASDRWNRNARIALPDWEDHPIAKAKRKRKQ